MCESRHFSRLARGLQNGPRVLSLYVEHGRFSREAMLIDSVHCVSKRFEQRLLGGFRTCENCGNDAAARNSTDYRRTTVERRYVTIGNIFLERLHRCARRGRPLFSKWSSPRLTQEYIRLGPDRDSRQVGPQAHSWQQMGHRSLPSPCGFLNISYARLNAGFLANP